MIRIRDSSFQGQGSEAYNVCI